MISNKGSMDSVGDHLCIEEDTDGTDGHSQYLYCQIAPCCNLSFAKVLWGDRGNGLVSFRLNLLASKSEPQCSHDFYVLFPRYKSTYIIYCVYARESQQRLLFALV